MSARPGTDHDEESDTGTEKADEDREDDVCDLENKRSTDRKDVLLRHGPSASTARHRDHVPMPRLH